MKVNVIYFDGCPNHDPVVSLVREVAAELNVQAELGVVKVSSPEDAVRERMLGSPTVLVDGLDIEPAARDRDDYAMSCRIYPGENGLPPREMIAAALLGRDHDAQRQTGSDSQGRCCP